MIKTYKIKHGKDFSLEIKKAKQIAKFAIISKSRSSADVKHFGLTSSISNQILKKYSNNKTVKNVKSVKLTIPGQGIKCNQIKKEISIPCLKLNFSYQFPNTFGKVNQIEVGYKYFYISVFFEDVKELKTDKYIGVDLNATGHCAVVAVPETQKVFMLGKHAQFIHLKYLKYRKRYQKRSAFKLLSKSKKRESNIVKDLNHKISKKIVTIAKENSSGIKLENLSGIRKTAKTNKSFRYTLNSWSFYQLNQFIEYKAKKFGIPVIYIEPAYTSQTCSKCGSLGSRSGKKFKCPICGHTTHADINAAFNIAEWVVEKRAKKELLAIAPMLNTIKSYISQSASEIDGVEGCTGQPQVAMSLRVRQP